MSENKVWNETIMRARIIAVNYSVKTNQQAIRNIDVLDEVRKTCNKQ